jgi:hypothetical protein
MDLTVQVAERGEVRRDLDWWLLVALAATRLLVALAATRARTPVARGENAGETLEEAAVVRARGTGFRFRRVLRAPSRCA